MSKIILVIIVALWSSSSAQNATVWDGEMAVESVRENGSREDNITRSSLDDMEALDIWMIALIVILCLIFVIVAALGILVLCCQITLWPGQYDGTDCEILKALKAKNSDRFNKLLGRRKLHQVRDLKGDTIFHVAARSDWPEEMTPVVLHHLGVCTKDVETSTATLAQVTDTGDQSKEEIFRAELNTWTGQVTKCLPSRFVPKSYDINSQNSQGQTPLHIACEEEKEDHAEAVVAVLLEQKAILDIRDGNFFSGNAPLHIAVKRGHVSVVRRLLPKNASSNKHLLNQKGADGETALRMASRQSDVETVKFIVEYLGDDTWRSDEASVVESAVAGGSREVLELLVEHGAKREALLEMAVLKKNVKVVKMIMTSERLRPGDSVVESLFSMVEDIITRAKSSMERNEMKRILENLSVAKDTVSLYNC